MKMIKIARMHSLGHIMRISDDNPRNQSPYINQNGTEKIVGHNEIDGAEEDPRKLGV